MPFNFFKFNPKKISPKKKNTKESSQINYYYFFYKKEQSSQLWHHNLDSLLLFLGTVVRSSVWLSLPVPIPLLWQLFVFSGDILLLRWDILSLCSIFTIFPLLFSSMSLITLFDFYLFFVLVLLYSFWEGFVDMKYLKLIA